MTDTSSWLWMVIDVAAVVILGVAMAYGGMMWQRRSRNPVLKRMSDDATHRLYGRSSEPDKTILG
jgi:hypothetical protein